jgi:transposase
MAPPARAVTLPGDAERRAQRSSVGQPADFRCGIDGLMRLCREQLEADPFCGAVYVFRNRRWTAVKLLVYDGQGFWLCHKRLSAGRFVR